MSNLTVIILTFNEEIHIKRCIDCLEGLNSRIIVVDSFSTDQTCDIALELGAEVYKNIFVNQAQQFQWAMENCGISSEWVLRVDADETIDEKLSKNISLFIHEDGRGFNGAIFNRKHIFLGRWIKYGGRYPLPMLRLFRVGAAHIEQRWMDEHIVLDVGVSCVLDGGFEDNNLNSVSWFIDKHNKYATREMVDIMLKSCSEKKDSEITSATSYSIRMKRFFKEKIYLKMPYFVRPFLYFIFRYIFQLGFLDGRAGFSYHFMQGLWYRCLVDVKCIEVEIAWRSCSCDQEKITVLEAISGFKLRDRT